MNILTTACEVLAYGITLVTLVPLLRADAWWIRGWDFPRVQLVAVALPLAFALWWLPALPVARWLLVGAILLQVFRILPYTPLVAKQVLRSDPDAVVDQITVMVANVLMDNRRSAGLLDHIRQHEPDVLCAVETDLWWQQQLDSIRDQMPHAVTVPLDNTYGMLVYSRHPLHEVEVQYLVEDDIPSIHGQVELPSGRRIHLHCLHPRPPYPEESKQTTERDGELLLMGKSIGEQDYATILMGDLNDVAWSRTTRLLQKISGLLDPRIGRGLYSSFGADNPLLRWPVDQVLLSRHFTLVAMRRLTAFGSDHFPLLAHLALEPAVEAEQVSEPADDAEQQEVDDKIKRSDPNVEQPEA